MTDLSPAAKAVDDAFWKTINDKWNIYDRRRAQLAAALRAAADQVVPDETWLGTNETCYAYYRQRCNTRRQLFAIAAELEGAN